MSQSDVAADDSSTESVNTQADLTEHITAIRERLDAIGDPKCDDMNDFDLVELRTELKQLQDIAESFRKDHLEDELENRIEPGEKLFGLSRIQSHNKFVKDDIESVIMRAVGAGIDYTQFIDLNASQLADMDEDLAEIGRYEYTYFR